MQVKLKHGKPVYMALHLVSKNIKILFLSYCAIPSCYESSSLHIGMKCTSYLYIRTSALDFCLWSKQVIYIFYYLNIFISVNTQNIKYMACAKCVNIVILLFFLKIYCCV